MSQVETVNQAIWTAIRRVAQFGAPFFPRDVRNAMRRPVRLDAVRLYCQRLAKGGYLERDEVADPHAPYPRNLAGYRLANDCGVDAPRLRADGSPIQYGAGRQQMWGVMRVLKRWSVAELAATASTEAWAVAPVEADKYCRALAHAGVIGRTGPGEFFLFQSRPNGPKAPRVRRNGDVEDPNTGAVYKRGQGDE